MSIENFDGYKFVLELNKVCDNKTLNTGGDINYPRSYGTFVGFWSIALPILDLTDEQKGKLLEMLENAQKY